MRFYIVLENQIINGAKAMLYYHFDDLNQAYAKLYTILAAAAVSELEYYSGYLLECNDTNMVVVAGQVFEHAQEEE